MKSNSALALGARRLAISAGHFYTSPSTVLLKEALMPTRSKRLKILLLSTLLVASSPAAFAKHNPLSKEEAERLAEVANSEDNGFNIVINDLVFKHLKKYLRSPQSRRAMRKNLDRLEDHRPVIEAKLNEYQVPEEIMALPIIESGSQNRPQASGKSKVAGLWSFLDSTARKFGLRVNQTVDDRLNVPLQTDAAMRYLLLNQKRFDDWELGILAYNMGEGALEKTMKKLGTRDAWVLNQNAPAGDREYLAKVMAVALILKHPTLLN